MKEILQGKGVGRESIPETRIAQLAGKPAEVASSGPAVKSLEGILHRQEE